MSLNRCPECGREVSTFAETCPFCGYPLKSDPLNAFKFWLPNDYALRGGVARNLSAPADVLRELAKAPDEDVRVKVARNPSAPADALRELARDRDGLVRDSVASNPSVTLEILKSWVSS